MDIEADKSAVENAGETSMTGVSRPSPAAATICLRQGRSGPEVLLGHRDHGLTSYGGKWVFPGGRVESSDRPDGSTAPLDGEDVARLTAVRELAEEADLSVAPARLESWSHWTTSPTNPKRFSVWFFVVEASGAGAAIADGSELRAVRWASPSDWLRSFRARTVDLAPPTWLTLTDLSKHASVTSVITQARREAPSVYRSRVAFRPDGQGVAMYEGDAGWSTGDTERDGPRHRIIVRPGAYVFVRSWDRGSSMPGKRQPSL